MARSYLSRPDRVGISTSIFRAASRLLLPDYLKQRGVSAEAS